VSAQHGDGNHAEPQQPIEPIRCHVVAVAVAKVDVEASRHDIDGLVEALLGDASP
jgi:hypothetical protein